MKEIFWLCCRHLIPNDYHILLNWCMLDEACVRACNNFTKNSKCHLKLANMCAGEKTSFPVKASQNFTPQACYLSCSWTVSFFIHAPVVKVLLCIICHWIILKAVTAVDSDPFHWTMDTCINGSWIFCWTTCSLGTQHVILPENALGKVWHTELRILHMETSRLWDERKCHSARDSFV